MQIVSWNVNGLRSVLKSGFLDWLSDLKPDVLCIQESRVLPDELDAGVLSPKGYRSFWMPAKKKGYSGTAAFVRKAPDNVRNMGIGEFDDEGRVQILEYPGLSIVNAYYPNSQPERKRIDYKLSFCETMEKVCNRIVESGRNVIVCGDYNIAHTPIDLARPKQNEDSPGFLPEEREAMSKFIGAGYVDTFRHFCPEPGHYSWWSYRANARANNVGWRIDYHCVNKAFLPNVKSASIMNHVMGSDHCPVTVTLK